MAHPGHQRLLRRVGVDPADEGYVELHEGRFELEDVAEGGEPGARIVNRQSDRASESGDRVAEAPVVTHLRVLRDFEDHAPASRRQQ